MKGLAFLSLFLVSGFIGTFLYSNIVTGPDYFAHPKPHNRLGIQSQFNKTI